MNKKVLIIYRYTPEYRIRFYELLRQELASHSIDLDLIYGQDAESKRGDYIAIDWGKYKKNKIFTLGKITLIWQPALKDIRHADLVIVEQANKLLINYYLIFRRFFTKKKQFAFWGHGLTLNKRKDGIYNKFKRLYTNNSDWWFGYTVGTKRILTQNGYPESRITVVENAIDTKINMDWYQSIHETEILQLRQRYQIGKNDLVGIYCGSLYKEKRIEFLLEAADKIKNKTLSFKLLIVGGGPDEEIIKNALFNRPWMIWAGAQFGRNKALHFKLADFFLLPGAIGLAVLDSFTFETPIITTNYEFHGPEFEYLEHGHNGIVANNTLEDYVNTTVELISNKERLNLLKKQCKENALDYTVENMVKNFASGIISALNFSRAPYPPQEQA
jgi:glycosyltransferase involved in cell wall biosynthesis